MIELPTLFLIVAAILDIASTMYATRHGLIELNPLFGKVPKFSTMAIIKLLITGIAVTIGPQAAIIIGFMWLGGAVWNAVQIYRNRKSQ